MEKLKFYPAKIEILEKVLKSGERKVFNFLNSHDIYHFKKTKEFNNALNNLKENSINIPDGTIVSFFLGCKKMRGTEFVYFVLEKLSFIKEKKHFFVGFEKEEINKLLKKFKSIKKEKVFGYNPPYIKTNEFEKEEINKIAQLINKAKADYVWVGLPCPKQNILTRDLFKKTSAEKFFNVGAALDFIIDKKKSAPIFWQNLGIEWLYRLLTDFKYSKKKVWRSLIGSFYALFVVEKIQ